MQTIISSIKQTLQLCLQSVRKYLRMRFGLCRNTSNKPLQYIRVLPKSGAL